MSAYQLEVSWSCSLHNMRASWMLLRIKDDQDFGLLQKLKVVGHAMDRLRIGIAND